MSDWFRKLSPASRAKLARKAQPGWIEPMLATLTEVADFPGFDDPRWLFEPKLDGVRCLVFREGNSVRLMSRNRKPLDGAYPELHGSLLKQRAPKFIADGEVVAFDGQVTSFSQLQGRLGLRDPLRAQATGIQIYLYLFDLLHLDGHDLRGLPLYERKTLLSGAIRFKDPLRYTEHRSRGGREFLDEQCAMGAEGLIAKRVEASYQTGRSRDWLKLKCSRRQEFVIVGCTDPQGSRLGFGALLLGYHEGGQLRYAGKVGTGFDDKLLRVLHGQLAGIEQSRPSVADPDRSLKRAHWVKPELVGEVAFSEWTRDGRLRHPRFLGLRGDKSARQITREKPVAPTGGRQ